MPVGCTCSFYVTLFTYTMSVLAQNERSSFWTTELFPFASQAAWWTLLLFVVLVWLDLSVSDKSPCYLLLLSIGHSEMVWFHSSLIHERRCWLNIFNDSQACLILITSVIFFSSLDIFLPWIPCLLYMLLSVSPNMTLTFLWKLILRLSIWSYLR